jgi:3-oxoacyl-[acyl-carrier protein] reductase
MGIAMKTVLVLGGSGKLGQALLRELHRVGASAVFTYYNQHDCANSLAHELSYPAYQVDLAQADAVAQLFLKLTRDGCVPDVVVHCAGVAPTTALADIVAAQWDYLQAVHGRAALQCAQQMHKRHLPGTRGALVLVSALDGVAPVPAPAHYAASQAALWGLTLALSKTLGPSGILVNLAVVGVLDGGIAAALQPELRKSYVRHAALGRTGTCTEAARALRWLALENTYLNGAQFPVTGGLG